MLDKINSLKGYMPLHEGEALAKWAEKFSKVGPILEIGTFGGKSAAFLAYGSRKNNQIVYTIDHHQGSEEHQLGEEYFDQENFDETLNRVNTIPLLQKNLEEVKEITNIIPIIGDANTISQSWQTRLGMLFIDGSHSFESASNDYENWKHLIEKHGALAFHDIYEDPSKGGQAPYKVFQKAINDGFKIFDRVDTTVCLTY